MSRTNEEATTILDAAANLAAANATWFNIEGPDQLIFEIVGTGAVNAYIDWDPMNRSAASSNNTWALNNNTVVYVHANPSGQCRAYVAGVGANEAALIRMRRVHWK